MKTALAILFSIASFVAVAQTDMEKYLAGDWKFKEIVSVNPDVYEGGTLNASQTKALFKDWVFVINENHDFVCNCNNGFGFDNGHWLVDKDGYISVLEKKTDDALMLFSIEKI